VRFGVVSASSCGLSLVTVSQLFHVLVWGIVAAMSTGTVSNENKPASTSAVFPPPPSPGVAPLLALLGAVSTMRINPTIFV
jgi:hypothetical protein